MPEQILRRTNELIAMGDIKLIMAALSAIIAELPDMPPGERLALSAALHSRSRTTGNDE